MCIRDSMSTKYLGKQFDIHGGGMDLKFPHHECEIAQGTGINGTEPVPVSYTHLDVYKRQNRIHAPLYLD